MRLTLVFAAVLAMGCGTNNLVPGPAEPRLPTDHESASKTASGIKMTVGGDDWSADPMNLDEIMVPLKVTIQNNSNREIAIRYDNFKLVAPEGRTYHAVPPMKMSGTAIDYTQPVSLRYRPYRFYAAPYYGGLFHDHGIRTYDDPFYYNTATYDVYDTVWTRQLPTEDMIEHALFEGVLQLGGRAEGFVYFPLKARMDAPVEMKATITSAANNDAIDTISFSLVRERDDDD